MTSRNDVIKGSFSASSFFSSIITSPHNQSSSLIISGKTGAGKSSAALNLCENMSIEIANLKGGTPEDYFSLDNVACIKPSEVLRLVEERMSTAQYRIFLLDDIGVGLNNRKWQSKINQNMNDIMQTVRTTNSFICYTVPSAGMIDSVIRNISHYYLEMELALFDQGYSIGKLFKVAHKYRIGKTYFQYLHNDGHKVVRVAFQQASKELMAAYEIQRRKFADELRKEKMAELTADISSMKPAAETHTESYDKIKSIAEE